MKCCELKIGKRKEALCLLECSGVYLNNGQTIIVKKEVAERMLKQYKPFLVIDKELDKDSLKNGFYEVPGGEKKESPKVSKVDKETSEAEVKEEKHVLDSVSHNKSMRHRQQVRKL